jgi:serine palmitoyltransferase
MDFERDIAEFLGTESTLEDYLRFPVRSLHSQNVPTSLLPTGALILLFRRTVRWFDHNVLKSLEEVLLSVQKKRRKRRGPLTKQFIVTEGIFEKDGAIMLIYPNS